MPGCSASISRAASASSSAAASSGAARGASGGLHNRGGLGYHGGAPGRRPWQGRVGLPRRSPERQPCCNLQAEARDDSVELQADGVRSASGEPHGVTVVFFCVSQLHDDCEVAVFFQCYKNLNRLWWQRVLSLRREISEPPQCCSSILCMSQLHDFDVAVVFVA